MGTFILRTDDCTLQICLNLVLVKPVACKWGTLEYNEK